MERGRSEGQNFQPLKEVQRLEEEEEEEEEEEVLCTRVGTLIVATIYLQLIQNRYMFRSFTVLQCNHQHCV